jgi:hypothetical protein
MLLLNSNCLHRHNAQQIKWVNILRSVINESRLKVFKIKKISGEGEEVICESRETEVEVSNIPYLQEGESGV